MKRVDLHTAWLRYYRGLDRNEALEVVRGHIESIRGRMMTLGRFPQAVWHQFSKRELVSALGMALGVHQQVLAGLRSVPEGGRLRGGGGDSILHHQRAVGSSFERIRRVRGTQLGLKEV